MQQVEVRLPEVEDVELLEVRAERVDCSSATPTWMARRCKNFLTHLLPWRFPAPRTAQRDGADNLMGIAGAARRYPHFGRQPEAHRRRCPRRRCS